MTAEVKINKLNIIITITIDTYCKTILINRKFFKENIFTTIIKYIKNNNPLIISNINFNKYISNKFISIKIYFQDIITTTPHKSTKIIIYIKIYIINNLKIKLFLGINIFNSK